MKPFSNEPELELRRESNRHVLTEALARLDERLPLDVPILVGEDEGAAVGFESIEKLAHSIEEVLPDNRFPK